MPVTSDASSQIHSHNDPRAKPNHEAADIHDLVEALKLRGMVIRQDNSLMPRVGSLGDFIPREFPGIFKLLHIILLFNGELTDQ